MKSDNRPKRRDKQLFKKTEFEKETEELASHRRGFWYKMSNKDRKPPQFKFGNMAGINRKFPKHEKSLQINQQKQKRQKVAEEKENFQPPVIPVHKYQLDIEDDTLGTANWVHVLKDSPKALAGLAVAMNNEEKVTACVIAPIQENLKSAGVQGVRSSPADQPTGMDPKLEISADIHQPYRMTSDGANFRPITG